MHKVRPQSRAEHPGLREEPAQQGALRRDSNAADGLRSSAPPEEEEQIQGSRRIPRRSKTWTCNVKVRHIAAKVRQKETSL